MNKSKIGIDLVTGRISTSEHSHKAAWAHLLAHQLYCYDGTEVKVLSKDESWDDYDLIYLYHGMEFQGSLNLFGGATVESANKIARLAKYRGGLVSLDIEMPDYGKLGKSRLKSCDDVWKNTDWDAISAVCETIPKLKHPCPSDSLCLGDSHCFSAYKPGQMVHRNDGKTLHGALKMGLKKLIEEAEVDLDILKHITLYFGNIDLRHHLCRLGNAKERITKMIIEYEKQIKDLGIEDVELVLCLPMPNDSRKLPKTGWYKGKPFWGTWDERARAVVDMNAHIIELCVKNHWKFYAHRPEIINSKGELDFSAMEKPRSVHLSPSMYRTNLGVLGAVTPEKKRFDGATGMQSGSMDDFFIFDKEEKID